MLEYMRFEKHFVLIENLHYLNSKYQDSTKGQSQP